MKADSVDDGWQLDRASNPEPTTVTGPIHPPRPDLPLLTALRFVAAATVVVFHVGQHAMNAEWVGDLFTNGYEAVSFFFVLSGFILTHIYAPEPTSTIKLQRFWSARGARIYPLYLFSLAVAFPQLLYAVAVSHVTPWSRFIGAVLTAPLLLQTWIPTCADVWNLPAWSVSVEACFYLLFPFLGRWMAGMNAKRLLAAAVTVAILVGVGRCMFLPFNTPSCSPGLRNFASFFPLLLLPQFVVGIAVARVYLDLPRPGHARAELLFLLASCAVIFVFRERSKFVHLAFMDVVSIPLFALAIYAGACARGPITAILSQRWLVWLGESSYALYLLHIPLLFWWTKLAKSIPGAEPTTVAGFWLYFAAMIAIAGASHHLIEKPGRAWWLRKSGVGRPSESMPVATL